MKKNITSMIDRKLSTALDLIKLISDLGKLCYYAESVFWNSGENAIGVIVP